MNQQDTVQREWLIKTWDEYPPEWFITLHWRTNPQKIETVQSYIKEFHRVFRRKFHWKLKGRVTRSSNIPMFPKGIGMVHFHERSESYSSRTGKYMTPFHTHTHLSNTKGYFRDAEHLKHFIDELVMDKKVRDMRKLRPEVSVKKWNHDHHQNYNLDCPKKRIKEYILGIPHLDIFSSDLLPVMNYAN